MLNKCNENMFCDARGCKNRASAYFQVKGLFKKIFLCDECQKQLYRDLAPQAVTKSPKNKISSVQDDKQGVIKSGTRVL